MVTVAHCEYTKKHRVVHLKKVNFMICEFYLSNENGVYNVKPHWTWRLNSNCTMGDFGYTGMSGDTEPGS